MRKRLITMISMRRMKSYFLGGFFLFLPYSSAYTLPDIPKIGAFLKIQAQKCALRLGLASQPIGTFKLFHDIEDDLEYILHVDSLRELTDSLIVYANGTRLISDEITPILLYESTCKFTFEFPLADFLMLLQQERMQMLVTTYKDQINEYIENAPHSCVKLLYKNYNGTFFNALLKVIKVKIHFSYKITKEDLEKESVSLLALILRKRVELRNWSDQSQDNVLFTMSYSPFRTINIYILP